MSGVIGVIADQSSRYTGFWEALLAINAPVNTRVFSRKVADRSVGRNMIVEDALNVGAEWVLFLDDDHDFPPTLLNRLLSHRQPIVASLYLRRAAPFYPIAYAERDSDGKYWPLDLASCDPNSLVQVVGVGTGGMLIRAEVFRQMKHPWFLHTTEMSEDLYFCSQAVELGIPIYVDTGARLGHIAPASLFPEHSEGKWCVGVNYASSTRILLPLEG